MIKYQDFWMCSAWSAVIWKCDETRMKGSGNQAMKDVGHEKLKNIKEGSGEGHARYQ